MRKSFDENLVNLFRGLYRFSHIFIFTLTFIVDNSYNIKFKYVVLNIHKKLSNDNVVLNLLNKSGIIMPYCNLFYFCLYT